MKVLRQKLFAEEQPVKKRHLTPAQKLRNKFINTVQDTSVKDEQLSSKLREKAKGYNIPILGVKSGQSSYQHRVSYMTDEFIDHIIDNNLIKSKKDAKWVQKNGKKIVESIENGKQIKLPGGGVIDPNKDPKFKELLVGMKKGGDERIVLNMKHGHHKNATVLAHELGHAEHKNGRSNKLAELNAKIQDKTRNSKIVKNSGALGLAAGFASGYHEGKEGESSTASKIAPYLIPATLNAPHLIEEADASRRGIKMLKAAGASKQQLRGSKKALAAAFGTYAIRPAGQLAMTAVGRVSGKLVGKARRKKLEKENKEEE